MKLSSRDVVSCFDGRIEGKLSMNGLIKGDRYAERFGQRHAERIDWKMIVNMPGGLGGVRGVSGK